MNFGQVKRRTLDLLRQYSIAGAEIPLTYNNHADYLNAIPGLVNDAVMEIATTTKKIPEVVSLDSLAYEDLGRSVRFELPDDFYQLVSGEVLRLQGGLVLHTNLFSTQGRNYLIVPKDEIDFDDFEENKEPRPGKYEITYYRYPVRVSDDPKDNEPIDNTPDTHEAIPFYVAGFLVSYDDMALSALFNNKFADRLANLSPGITAEIHITSDAYDFSI